MPKVSLLPAGDLTLKVTIAPGGARFHPELVDALTTSIAGCALSHFEDAPPLTPLELEELEFAVEILWEELQAAICPEFPATLEELRGAIDALASTALEIELISSDSRQKLGFAFYSKILLREDGATVHLNELEKRAVASAQ